MLVSLTHTASISLDLEVRSVTWALPIGRKIGSAELFVPVTSAAYSSAYLSDREPFLVELFDKRLGTWAGIATRTAFDRTGVAISVVHLTSWATIRRVNVTRTLKNLTAGAIAYAAVLDAVAGLGRIVLRPGTFVEAAPIIPVYEFRGQYLAEVLGALMDQTGNQEWVCSDAGVISWVPRQGTLLARHLCDDGDVVDGAGASDFTERLAEAMARSSDGRELTVRDGANAASLWPRQSAVSVDGMTAGMVGAAAAGQLAAGRATGRTITLRLKETVTPQPPQGSFTSGHDPTAVVGDTVVGWAVVGS